MKTSIQLWRERNVSLCYRLQMAGVWKVGFTCNSLSAVVHERRAIERFYPHAKFGRSSSSQPLEVIPSTDVPPVRWSSITDPSIPGSLPANIKPLHVCLKRGETLYLPAGWWHYVQQGKEMTIAINWWYDMEMRGVHWVFLNLLRNEEGLYVDSEDRESDPDSWILDMYTVFFQLGSIAIDRD